MTAPANRTRVKILGMIRSIRGLGPRALLGMAAPRSGVSGRRLVIVLVAGGLALDGRIRLAAHQSGP
jgi:hypothetical protein